MNMELNDDYDWQGENILVEKKNLVSVLFGLPQIPHGQ
jgi:hypothetical protein